MANGGCEMGYVTMILKGALACFAVLNGLAAIMGVSGESSIGHAYVAALATTLYVIADSAQKDNIAKQIAKNR